MTPRLMIRRAFQPYPASTPKLALFGAGQNPFGECGINGNSNVYPTGSQYLPGLTSPMGGMTDPDTWAKFASVGNHSLAIKADGTLWASGYNAWGQLGQNNTTNLRIFTQVGSATNWTKVGVGTEFSGMLNSAGEVWTMGRNDIAAQIGNGTTTGNSLVPYNTSTTGATYPARWPVGKVFRDMEVGHRFMMGIDSSDDIWTWGNNGSRQLGRQSNTTGMPKPGGGTYSSSDADYIANATQDNNCLKIDQAGPWSWCRAGAYHAVAKHKTSGEIWSWGLSSEFQRGAGVVSQNPAIIAKQSGLEWTDAALGEYTTFLVRSDGTLWVTGRNTNGQAGVGSTTQVSGVTQVGSAANWRFIQSALDATFGIKLDGTLWAWGNNTNNKTSITGGGNITSPTQVGAATNWNCAYANQYSAVLAKNA